MSSIEEQCKRTMIAQWAKFLRIYNELAGTSMCIDEANGAYDDMIRSLGRYISTQYDPAGWSSSTLAFGDAQIEMNKFVGTPYEDKVARFLAQLRRAFEQGMDDDVTAYLAETDDFTQREKAICAEYYSHISSLHREMKRSAFVEGGDLSNRANMSGYHEVLRAFNAYMSNLAADQGLYNLIRTFDGKFRHLAANKKPEEVLFDV